MTYILMVIFLKIILFKKKTFFIFSLVLLFITLNFIYYSISSPSSITCNTSETLELEDKIKNIYNGNEKIAYLTFDDGPSPSVTPKILDILKEENIKASFFVIGKKVKEHPEIVIRAYEEGHYIANHTYSHNNSLLYKDSNSFISEIKNTDLAIASAIGVDNYSSHIFRFPNGFMSKIYKSQKEKYAKLLPELDYTYIDWNALNNDSEKKYTHNQLLNNLKNSTKNKTTLVILMHDSNDVNDSSTVLKESIDYLKKEGYEFRNFYNL